MLRNFFYALCGYALLEWIGLVPGGVAYRLVVASAAAICAGIALVELWRNPEPPPERPRKRTAKRTKRR